MSVTTANSALLRHTLKTISYRILGTLTTFTVSYVTTGSVAIASTIGVTELMIKPVIYFFMNVYGIIL